MTLPPLPDSDWTPGATLCYSADQMRAYAEQCVAQERERCAAIADESMPFVMSAAVDILAAIRKGPT